MAADSEKVEITKPNGKKVEVSAWAMAVTYICCWVFGGLILASTILNINDIHNRGLLLGVGIYLILWPVFQINPLEVIRRIWPAP